MIRFGLMRRRRGWALVVAFAACVPLGACSLVNDLSGFSTAGAVLTEAGSTDAPSAGDGDGGDGGGGALDTGVLVPLDAAAICRPRFHGPSCSTRCPAGTAGAACDYELVLGLDIPVAADWNAASDVPYSDNRTGSAGPFSRVGYRFVLDDQEVWVELDAFTTDATRLGVPVEWTFQQPVTNAIVFSFAANLPHVLVPTDGNVEFWSDCYGAGPDGKFDHDDEKDNSPGCFGSMQVHVGGTPVLSLNRWTEAPAGDLDIGIGPAPVNNLDWTFAKNAGQFSKRRLEVYVR